MSVRCTSYDDLAMITDNFNVAREIGRGGYATVYYGERNGQVCGFLKQLIYIEMSKTLKYD